MPKKNNKKVIKIEIDQSKIIKTILIVAFVVIICLIGFFVSSSKSITYSDGTETATEEEQNLILEQATKDAGEVSDDERTQPKEISIQDYLDLYKADTYSVVLISRPTCQYCKIATPILENIIYESKVEINYLNSDNFSEEDNKTLISSDDYFESGYGTPLLLIVGKNEIKDQVAGLVDKETYESFFIQYGFME